MKTLTAIFVSAALLVYFFGGSFIVSPHQGKEYGGRGQAAAVAVEIRDLQVGRLLDQAVFSGSILPKSYLTVSPKIGGQLKTLKVDIGDEIRRGEIVATLDDEELKLAVKIAEADLEIAAANLNESKALLDVSKSELERVRTMRKQQISSESDVEVAQANYQTRLAKHEVNKAIVQQKQTALQAARLRLSYSQIDVTWSNGGEIRLVSERFQDEGGMLNANTPIISVIDVATLTVVIDVVEKDFFRMKPSLIAIVEVDSLPEETFSARVARISPLIDSTSRQARVELELSNPKYKLKPGLFVRVRVVYQEYDAALLAPTNSLARRNDKEGVFLADIEALTASFVPVELGFVDLAFFQIASPTISGSVVTLGHHLLEDGAKIILPSVSKSNNNQKPVNKQKDTGRGPSK